MSTLGLRDDLNVQFSTDLDSLVLKMCWGLLNGIVSSLVSQERHDILCLPFPSPFSSILYLPSPALAACSWNSQELGHNLVPALLDMLLVLGGCKMLLYRINVSCSLTLRPCCFQSTKKGLLTKHQILGFLKITLFALCWEICGRWGEVYIHIHSYCVHASYRGSAYLRIYGSVSTYTYVYMHRLSLICRTG